METISGTISRFFSLSFMLKQVPFILSYLPVTLFMAICATVIGWCIGFAAAMARLKKVPVLSNLSSIYVSFIRGTPQMVQIYLTYYGIPVVFAIVNALRGEPAAPVRAFAPMVFAIIAFSINCGAYSSETIRAAILSIDRDQKEAAYAIGLNGFQTMRRIILPQALLIVLPMLCNSLISNILGTSLAFIVSVVDIMAAAKLAGGRSYRYFEVFVLVALIYWFVCLIVEKIMARLERKLRIPGAN
jgi:His/Glu/Gln/Arg/opine family amino acid ABC transporter permease subunit